MYNKYVVKKRLNDLYDDLFNEDEEAVKFFNELHELYGDKRESIMNLYAQMYAPVRAMSFDIGNHLCSGDIDMTEFMLNFSNGFDDFINQIEDEFGCTVKRKFMAIELLAKLLSLPYPSSKILYLTYYKMFSTDEITNLMFISRASYYRYKKEAITKLMEVC